MSKGKTKSTKFRNLWILGICIHILTFLFVLDLYFTSPIKHGMTPHKSLGEPLAKRVVVFIADGLRAEAIYPKDNWSRAEFLNDLRLNQSCSWGVVHTGVPTESRPGHVAIFAGLMEDPSALFTGWQANIVEFDSVINESNYAWSYGSPDIVKIFTKKDKARLNIDYYDPDQEDFSGRTSTINLDTWVFKQVEELLTPKGNSCEAQLIRKSTLRRRLSQERLNLEQEREKCNEEIENCEGQYFECYNKYKPCLEEITQEQLEVTMKEADLDVETLGLMSCLYNFDKQDCQQLCATGTIFFLHLLGMDTAGHVHKPNSREYLENLLAVDQGIRETTFLFHEFFRDNDTAFLFTADHGMTDWGSHGDGSEYETEVPYILWGKGVEGNKLRQDLKQTDLAPLLSSLIGANIPVNSVGILPHRLLNGSYAQIAEAVFANVMQHVEQYKLLLSEFDLDPLFNEYPAFQNGYVEATVEEMRLLLNKGDKEKLVARIGEELMKEILSANGYMRNYYFKPKVVAVMLGFLMWILYLSLSIHIRDETKNLGDKEKIKAWRSGTRGLTSLLMIFAFLYLKGLQVKWFTYVYPIFILGVMTLFSEDRDVINQLWIICNIHNRIKFFTRTVIYVVLVQLLVFGFFNRMFCAAAILILAFWLTQNNLPLKTKVTSLIVTCALALLQMVELSTKFNYYGLAIGTIFWIAIYVFYIYPIGSDYTKRFDLKYKTMIRNIILMPLLIYLVSSANVWYVAHAFDSEIGHSDMNLVISWVVTAIIPVLIPMSPRGVLIRFGHICGGLIVPYVLMAVNIDVIFYSALVLTLFYWMEVESKMAASSTESNPLEMLHFGVNYTPKTNFRVSDIYRRTYFFLALTVCYFFAIGNMASFNGFDPQWTRTYVATFNPFLMTALILIKMIIPFFLITCAFYVIVLSTRASDTKVFTVLLLFLDQMLMNFMLCVRNEGSWLEIGKSLSHFAVMEAMALVMLIFFGIARYVCSFRIGDAATGYEPVEDGGDDSETNVDALIEEGLKIRRNQSDRDESTIKNKLWYLPEFLFTHIKKHSLIAQTTYDKYNNSESTFNFPTSLFNYYLGGTSSKATEEGKEFKSNETQCNDLKYENEKQYSSTSFSKIRKQAMDNCDPLANPKSMEAILAGSKHDVFQVAFDLGIAATLEHCVTNLKMHEKSRRSFKLRKERPKPNEDSKLTQKSSPNFQLPKNNEKIVKSTPTINKPYNPNPTEVKPKMEERTNKEQDESISWKPKTRHRPRKTVYNLTYYDIFPTVDKIQAKDLRTIHEKPFVFQEGYLNISTEFDKNAEGDNVGMISHPSYEDVDCHFYSDEYSATQLGSSSSCKDVKVFKANYFSKKKYQQGFKRINSVPHLDSSRKIRKIDKISSECDVERKKISEGNLNKQQPVSANKEGKNREGKENILKNQLEKFNLNKAVYSTIKPGLNVSSKVSIIRTESYFDPKEIAPAGSRIFRESRTSFNSPDVLKLAPGLSQKESAYHFLNEEKKYELIQKLIASSRPKTPCEENLINSYIKQHMKKGLSQSNSCSSSSVSSIHSNEDSFEILHKEAVRNQKQRRRDERIKMKQLVEAAKAREKERLEQEELMKKKAEEALKIAEDRRLEELARKRNSSICLASSEAIFDLGVMTKSEIKVVSCADEEIPLKLDLPEDDNKSKAVPNVNVWKDKSADNSAKLNTFRQMSEIIALEAMKLVPEPEESPSKIPKPGNYSFRQVRQDKELKTRNPLIKPPVKKKDKTKAEISTDTEREEDDVDNETMQQKKPRDKRKKRRKLKPVRISDVNEENKCYPKNSYPNRCNKSKSKSEMHDTDTNNETTNDSKEDTSTSKTNANNANASRNNSKTEESTTSGIAKDRYDKSCCARKRPSPKFLSNIQEMAVKMSNVQETSESDGDCIPIARLPIRVVPGMLANGVPVSIPSANSKRRSQPNLSLVQPPSEEIIKEEREVVSSPSTTYPTSIRRSVSSTGGRHKPFTKSSPTLLKIGCNSTLVTDPAGSEQRLINDSQSNVVNVNLSMESMPESMLFDIGVNDSDPTSIYSDLPEDNTLREVDVGMTIEHKNCNFISFEGITTSKSKLLDSTANIHQVKNRETAGPSTCFGLFEVKRRENLESERDIEGSTMATDETTPRFIPDDSDPAKYLVKVESWLNNINNEHTTSSTSLHKVNDRKEEMKISQTYVDGKDSESTVNSDDLIEYEYEQNCAKLDPLEPKSQASLRSQQHDKLSDCSLPSVDRDLTMSIATALMEEQRRNAGHHVQSLIHAYQTVKYVLRCARAKENLKKTNNSTQYSQESSGIRRNHETSEETTQTDNVNQTSSSTQIFMVMETAQCGNDFIGLQSQNSQTTYKLLKARTRSRAKSTQCIIRTDDKHCLTDNNARCSTSNIGIQHSFTDIGVNTVTKQINTGSTQCAAKMVDAQVGTVSISTPRNVVRKENDASLADKSYKKKEYLVYPIESAREENKFKTSPSLRNNSKIPSPLSSIKSPKNIGQSWLEVEKNKNDLEKPKYDKTSTFESTVRKLRIQNARKIIRKKNDLFEIVGTTKKQPPTLPSELCHKSQLSSNKLEIPKSIAMWQSLRKSAKSLPQSPVESKSALVPPLNIASRSYPTSPRKHKSSTSSESLRKIYNIPQITKETFAKVAKLTLKAKYAQNFQNVPTPRTLDRMISTYAKIEASKPYKPALEDVNKLQSVSSLRPKVKSVPRTDFAELPEERLLQKSRTPSPRLPKVNESVHSVESVIGSNIELQHGGILKRQSMSGGGMD